MRASVAAQHRPGKCETQQAKLNLMKCRQCNLLQETFSLGTQGKNASKSNVLDKKRS